MPRKKAPPAIPLSSLLDLPGFERNLQVEVRSESRNRDLIEALIREYEARRQEGLKFRAGRKLGTVDPIRLRLRALLRSAPGLKNAELWEAVKARPPKGWTLFESSDPKLGRYYEGPRPDLTGTYKQFQNLAAEERKRLKG